MLVISSALFIACQKEVSFERGSVRVSVGSMAVDGTGNCLGAVVAGNYYKDTTLTSSNSVDVTVQVDTVGTYVITSDTVNGYYFKASGTFSATGSQTVKLAGTGKPLATGTNIFTVTYNGTTCQFTVTVSAPSGGGGGGSTTYTVNCATAVLAGTYQSGTALTSANTVTLTVNVTVIGPWSLSTTPAVNGVTFSGSGTFSTSGSQTIVLTGAGTPSAGGTFNFPITVGTSSCNFPVTFTTIPDYFPRTTNSNWSYQYDGDPNDSLLIFVSPATHSALGNTYNVFFYNDGTPPVDTFGYYRRAGADYFEWIDMGSYIGLDDPLWMEYIFLKDNLTVGGTWNSTQFTGPYTDGTGNTFNVTLRWVFTILQQNAPVTVNGTSYTNTIEVKQELQQQVGANWQLAAYFRSFYSLNKGLIKQDFYDANDTKLYAQDVRRLVVY